MALASDRCICLRKTEYSETSQILLLFARGHGLVRLIAKGSHRRTKAGASRFDGGVDLLELGDAVFTDDPAKDINTLTEWKLSDGHPVLRRDLRSMYLGLYCGELVSLLIEEHDAHPDLFDRLQQTLAELAPPRAEEIALSFQLDLLRETGYLPELAACVACSQPLAENERVYFSAARGGVVCRECEGANPDRQEMDIRLLRLTQGILKLPRANGQAQRLPRLTRHQTDPLNRLLAEHVEQTLGRRLRMRRWIVSVG